MGERRPRANDSLEGPSDLALSPLPASNRSRHHPSVLALYQRAIGALEREEWLEAIRYSRAALSRCGRESRMRELLGIILEHASRRAGQAQAGRKGRSSGS